MAGCPQHGMAARYNRHDCRRHPGGSPPLPEGVKAWLRHPCVVKKRAAEYGFQVDGAFADGNDGDLCQRRRRGTAEHSGANVGVMKKDLMGFAAFLVDF